MHEVCNSYYRIIVFQWSFATDIYTVVDCVVTISQLLCGDDKTHLLIVTVIEVCVLTVVVDVQPYARSFREEDCRVNFISMALIRFKIELWYNNL